ncbi:elongation factor Tu, mitochondrial-like [Solanum dulcamara]|uniref:elongation factor Tu, mitochondrial-like n=1 Tax=Solanum dulcamara TaxID=45834 RepID=UPI0024860E4C|nr:elongation factor Tu, mitochondrial-like [Solanum dulcamara]
MYPGDEIPIICGSALSALQGTNEEIGKKAILKLMDAVDEYIPDPVRQLDKPFLMPVEAVFSIQGRETVATSRVEQGTIKVGEDVEMQASCYCIQLFYYLPSLAVHLSIPKEGKNHA